MLPLDPPFADRATIGGLLATNDSGPLRHRYGTPRDLVIGIQLATTDGVLSKAGGQVVKNVAGYDLSKLVSGSFGSLAAIVSATFKLAPLPAASKTLRIGVARRGRASADDRRGDDGEPARTGRVRDRARRSTPNPQSSQSTTFCELRGLCVVRLDPIRVAARRRRRADRAGDGSAEAPARRRSTSSTARPSARCGTRTRRRSGTQPGAIVRASWLPANIAAVLGEPRRARRHGANARSSSSAARRSAPD